MPRRAGGYGYDRLGPTRTRLHDPFLGLECRIFEYPGQGRHPFRALPDPIELQTGMGTAGQRRFQSVVIAVDGDGTGGAVAGGSGGVFLFEVESRLVY